VGSALTLAFFHLSVWAPVIGLIAGLLVPFPCIYVTVRFGRPVGYALVALVLGFLAFVDVSDMIFYLLQYAVLSIVLPDLLLRGKGSARSVHYSVVLAVLFLSIWIFCYWIFYSVNSDVVVAKEIQSTITAISGMYQTSVLAKEDIQRFLAGLQQAEKILLKIYPALIVIFYYMTAGFNLLLLRKASCTIKKPVSIGSLPGYRNPDILVWFFITAGFGVMFDSVDVTRVALIILVVTFFLYLVQGIAILLSYCDRSTTPRFLRIVLFASLVLLPYLSLAVSALGLFDMWVDFRSLKKTENL